MWHESRIKQLIVKKLRGELSAQEKEELEAWSNESPSNKKFIETRMQPKALLEGIKIRLERDPESMRRKYNNMRNELILNDTDTVSQKKIYWRWALAAAVVMAVVFLEPSLWNKNTAIPPLRSEDLKIKLMAMKDYVDTPTLHLSDGTTIFFSRASNKVVFESGGWRVSQIDSQHIAYSLIPAASAEEKKSRLQWIGLSIPFGQSWKISLPDGTQAQLSTGSSLLYAESSPDAPTRQRLVAIKGEAWLGVSTDPAAPFIAVTRTVTTNVIGTSFNIRDYAQENSARVTLLTGSIKVSYGKISTILRPGQEARIDTLSENIRVVTDVDTANRLKWRSEYFDFNNMNIRDIMRQVAQWYGKDTTVFGKHVDTTSQGLVGQGSVKKVLTLLDLSNLMEQYNLKISVEGKKLIVEQRK